MRYQIRTTKYFDSWFSSIKDIRTRARIINRLDLLESGHFGDNKSLGGGVSELRLFFGSGYRIYYTFNGNELVLLLCAGDKSTQSKDIKKAQKLVKLLE